VVVVDDGAVVEVVVDDVVVVRFGGFASAPGVGTTEKKPITSTMSPRARRAAARRYRALLTPVRS